MDKHMTFADYQAFAVTTAIYPNQDDNLTYPALGVAGEAGEVADLIKKVMRDHDAVLQPEQRALLKKELGDLLWYIAMVCEEAVINMQDVVYENVAKLIDRQERGVLHGSGDLR